MAIDDLRLRTHQKIAFDSYINLQTRIRNYVLTQKNFVDSYTNWRTRIPEYVLKKNPNWFIYHPANEDSRSRTHAKKFC